ncbi:MAG: four helix bundle protein [Candidatus Doudnabacteria bacterium]|nr:four helix bundle protein [Candidatus Doudnabacteria bacterium]
MEQTYHENLKAKIKEFCHLSYKICRGFPKDELYGITSQFRRAVISVALNYTEGYARIKEKVHKNFIEISYGSLKEVLFLINFCHDEKFMSEKDFQELNQQAEEIARMLWGMLRRMP